MFNALHSHYAEIQSRSWCAYHHWRRCTILI